VNIASSSIYVTSDDISCTISCRQNVTFGHIARLPVRYFHAMSTWHPVDHPVASGSILMAGLFVDGFIKCRRMITMCQVQVEICGRMPSNSQSLRSSAISL